MGTSTSSIDFDAQLVESDASKVEHGFGDTRGLDARALSTDAGGYGLAPSDNRYCGDVTRGFALRSTHKWMLALVLVSGGANAQSLHDAFEKAWERQPLSQAQGYRAAELSARAKAAGSWVPAPPSVGVRERSDRFNGNSGIREFETELAVPLWLPGQRDRQAALVNAETDLRRDTLAAARWKLAGEVRDAYWLARSAESDAVIARRRLGDATALAADVERRLKAGDLARTDFNQAKGAENAARAAVGESELRMTRALQSFTLLTGLGVLPDGDEAPAAGPPPSADHPTLRALERTAAAADARIRQAAGDTRDSPELTLGWRRERSTSVDPHAATVTLGIRIPLATDSRNESRIAAANAEFIEARTAIVRQKEVVEADIVASSRELAQARGALTLAEERQRLSAETDQLLGKAFRLGEIDLATRLRIAAERYAADADVSRSRLELGRAASRLNQAFGVLL